jgi:hypothetical protein
LASWHAFAIVRSVLALPSVLLFARHAFLMNGSYAPASRPDQSDGGASMPLIEKAWRTGILGSYAPLLSHTDLVNTHNFSQNYPKMAYFSLNKSRIYPWIHRGT